MNQSVLIVILIPFTGTTLGALCVYFMKQEMPLKIEKRLSGFAAGVMVSASIWGLLIPSMEQSSHLNELKNVIARLRAVKELDHQYTNYSGLVDGVKGSVYFVIETESLK